MAAHEQSEIRSKKNKEEILTKHMATEQCYFEKDTHETLSWYTTNHGTQWKQLNVYNYKQGDLNTDRFDRRFKERQLN